MLKSGDRVEIVSTENFSGHCFKSGEIVYFLGILGEESEVVFVCTNGETEQGLFMSDFRKIDK